MTTKTIKETRNYKGTDKEGNKQNLKLEYTINIEDDVVKSVINQSGFEVELNSEVFAHYSKKFNGKS